MLSSAISRNNGDTDTVVKDTIDNAYNEETNENYDSIQDEFYDTRLYSLTKEDRVQALVTYNQRQCSNEDNCDIVLRNHTNNNVNCLPKTNLNGKEEIKREHKQNNLDRFVTKADCYGAVNKEGDDDVNCIGSNQDQSANSSIVEQSDLHKAHLIQTLQAIQYIRTLVPNHSLESKYVNLPASPKFCSPEETKTIIFDLDETLIHCVDDPETDDPDIILPISFETGEEVEAGINIRPYAIECLKRANKYFQVVVFTASHQSYADVVLDYLDPDHILIQHRLYRDSCILTPEGVYIKDLRIIKNRKLENMVIVDNAVYSFGFQMDNGIPIIPFYNDPSDEELHHLVFYMKSLSTLSDMRIQNRNAFQLSLLDSDFIESYLAEYYQKIREESEQNEYKEYIDNPESFQVFQKTCV